MSANEPLGPGKAFLFKIESKKNESFRIPWPVEKLINTGFHYSGGQKIWDKSLAFAEAANDTEVNQGNFLVGTRLINTKGKRVDIDIYEHVTYVAVPLELVDKFVKIFNQKPEYSFS